MTITAMEPPALCQLPLIEAPASTHGVIKLKRRPAGFLARMAAKARVAADPWMPLGYQDETGFHHGVNLSPGHEI